MSEASPEGRMRIGEAALEAEMRMLTTARGPGKSICPSEVARALAGEDPKRWKQLMPAIRRVAVRLARAGELRILRKGKPVDPGDFKGVYRLACASEAFEGPENGG
ncbi:MAG: DUF3253 domain-containing protein [Salinarimonas sp.]